MFKRKRPAPTAADWAKWQAINHDLVDWLYAGSTGRFQIAGHEQIDSWAADYQDKIVVEVGCGHGHHLQYGQNLYQHYIGLDIEFKFLQTVQQRFANTRVVHGDAYSLPFRAASVDCVLSVYNFEHLRTLPECLDEVCRVLKPNGELLIGLPAEGGMAYEIGRWLTSKRYMERKYGIDYMSVVRWEHWNTYQEVRHMLEEKFKILEARFIPFRFLPTIHANVIGCLRAVPLEGVGSSVSY